MSYHGVFVSDVESFPALPAEPMDAKPCGDCAAPIFYREIVDALIDEPDAAFREEVAARWFCHCQPNRRCRGVRDALENIS